MSVPEQLTEMFYPVPKLALRLTKISFMTSHFASAALAAALVFSATSATANIYSFTDDRGVVHFSNLPHLDKRYRVVYRIPTDVNQRPNAWSAKGPTSVDIAKYIPIIDSAARAYGLDPKLVHAVIRAESGYNPNALSPKGAVGMMQLIPATAQRYGVRNSNDPTENIHGGSRYLSDLVKMFNGNVELALAGYNAGENAVIRAGNRIPPYPETMAYVPKVMGFYRSVDLTRF
jgi:soluble lytic murein transglycosylase-like protein